MRRQVWMVVVAVLLAAGSGRADENSRRAKATEMLQLTNADQMIKQTLERMRAIEMQQLANLNLPADAQARTREVQDKVNELIVQSFNWEKLKPEFVSLYATTFTDEELDGILGFYKSPAGRAMVEKMPSLMANSIAISQKIMQGLQPRIREILESAAKDK